MLGSSSLADYTDVDQLLTFSPGSATTECVDVTILNDDIFEGPETFEFVIPNSQSDSAVFVVSPDSATVTITDPEDSKCLSMCSGSNLHHPSCSCFRHYRID